MSNYKLLQLTFNYKLLRLTFEKQGGLLSAVCLPFLKLLLTLFLYYVNYIKMTGETLEVRSVKRRREEDKMRGLSLICIGRFT